VTDPLDLAVLLYMAIVLILEWIVTDPLNLFVLLYMAIVLTLGWIVVGRQ